MIDSDLPPLMSMPATSRRRLQPFALLTLGALIAAALLFVLARETVQDRAPVMEEMQAQALGEDVGPASVGLAGMIGGAPFKAMMARVDATEDQITQIRALAQGAIADVERMTGYLQPLRAAALEELSRPNASAQALAALRARVADVSEAVRLRVAFAMIAIAEVLTPEQRAQLAIGATITPAAGRAGLADADVLQRPGS
ncbi:MAG: Spy/CpxP family protein refolding chaperone [Elsteraceae bacterium]